KTKRAKSILFSHFNWKKIEESNGVNQNVLRWRHLPDPAKPVLIFFTPRAIAPRRFKLESPNLARIIRKIASTKWLSRKIENWAPWYQTRRRPFLGLQLRHL